MITKTDRRLHLCITLLVLNIVFIWGNSLLPGEISGALSHWLKDLLSNLLSIKPSGDGGHGLLRKAAHFTEFASLGVCLSCLLRMIRQRPWEHYIFPFLGGVAVACVDETIQIFVPDRGPGILDVMIDSTGVLAGIGLFCLVYFMKNRGKLSAEG